MRVGMLLAPLAAGVIALAMIGSSCAAEAAVVVTPAARAPRTIRVPAVDGAAALALASATRGDTVVLAPGVHRGALRITAAITLRGEPGAIVDGGNSGSVIIIASDDATLESLAVRGSGRDVMKVDAAVQVLTSAHVRIRNLEVSDVLYGIYAERATAMQVEGCSITGRVKPMDESGTGNGIHLWYCAGGELTGNRVERFLDAVYLAFANDIVITDNRLQWNGRYGLHTMYCQGNRLERNTFTFNLAGCALMFSNGLVMDHNDFVHNRGSRTYGLLLRDCSAGTFTNNRLADNTVAVFMDGSNRNKFRGNLIENNGWGLLVFASCAKNEFAANNFIQNDYPVALDMRRTSNQFDDGRTGNYWSENAAYDLDDDGVSDVPYAPVSAFAFVSKQYPDLTILAKSPAVAALAVAERVFPAMRPSEAVDRFPLIRPARVASAERAGIPRAAGPRLWGVGAGYVLLLGLGLLGMTAARARTA